MEYRLSKYIVEKKQNKKEYTLKKEVLEKCVTSENKIYQIPREETDIRIYSDEYRIFKLYKNIYDNTLGKVKENNLGYSIQIKSYLLEPKYRYIQIGIDEEKGISIFCDKKEEKAYIGLTYAFLSRRMVKNVYDKGIYYWGEKSTDNFLKEDLLSFCCLNKRKEIVFENMVEIDFADKKNNGIFPNYVNPTFVILRQNSKQNEEKIRDIVINCSVEDIDISMCKYGMKYLSEVKSITLCCNSNKNNIVKLTGICKKLIEVCKVDKLLKEIEKEKKPGSKIEGEKKKLRDSIDKTFKNLNDDVVLFEDIIIQKIL